MSSESTPVRSSLRPTGLHALDLSPTRNLRYDLPAGLVVFLVALPLCLGVALASNAPLLSGLVAGVAGGLLVPLISRAPLSVSGPAAGLAAIVATGVSSLGSYQAFATSVVLAGALQIVLGFMRGGVVASFIPNAVIRGMLAAIGVLLILKQVPHALGYDAEAHQGTSYAMTDSPEAFSQIGRAFGFLESGAIVISLVSLGLLIAFERVKSLKSLTWLPGALAVVVVGTTLNELFLRFVPALALNDRHLVSVPTGGGPAALLDDLPFADLGLLSDPRIWTMAVTIAVVASLETLLSLEAIDKLDPFKRRSDPDRELLAQGIANSVSGFFGGLPITSVIVRSSANVNSGGRTRVAAFVHGLLLALSVVFAGALLNRIPLAALASILLVTGYKLAKPSLFKSMYGLGMRQFIPFFVTIAAIVVTDLLRGIVIGIVLGIINTIRSSMSGAFEVVIEEEGVRRLRFLKDIHFFHKAAILEALESVPEQTLLTVDKGAADFVERDVVEMICEFQQASGTHGVKLELAGIEPVRTLSAH